MNAYELISSDLAARLGLKRMTLTVLAASLATNCLLGVVLLFKNDPMTTVLVPVGFNETTHPLTISDSHVDEDYLMLVARDLLSLALNLTPVNADHNRLQLLKHVAPSAFGEIDEALKHQSEKIKQLRASTFFAAESMDVDTQNLTVTASGIRQHFIGKTQTRREKITVTLRFSLVGGRLQLTMLTDLPNEQPQASLRTR